MNRLGEIKFLQTPKDNDLVIILFNCNINIINDHKLQLVQKIKDLITMVGNGQSKVYNYVSNYLTETSSYFYTYL